MKTLIFNTFSTFSTFPMFNPAYLKGFLLRDGIEREHIDINHIVCSKLLSKDFLQSLVFNKNNVSSTNSEQCKLCVNGPLYIDARLLWKQTIGSNCP